MSDLTRSMAKNASAASVNRYPVPYYKLQPGTSMVVRFLANQDPAELFYAQLNEMSLPFGGIVNSPEDDTFEDVTVKFPSLTTWGTPDPILKDQKKNWDFPKDSPQRDLARTYYFKKFYYMQGIIMTGPLVEQNEPANPIRPFRMGPQLFDTLKGGLNESMEYAPFGDTHGRDFTIRKTLQGQFGNYSTSSWSFRERPWGSTEQNAVDKYGPADLAELIGPEPDQDVVDMTWELYQASLKGEPFDHAKWGSHFRARKAFGSTPATGSATAPALSDEQRDATLLKAEALKVRATTKKTPETV